MNTNTLTDEQIADLWLKNGCVRQHEGYGYKFARAIESAVRGAPDAPPAAWLLIGRDQVVRGHVQSEPDAARKMLAEADGMVWRPAFFATPPQEHSAHPAETALDEDVLPFPSAPQAVPLPVARGPLVTEDQMREHGIACRKDERQRTLAAEWEASRLRGALHQITQDCTARKAVMIAKAALSHPAGQIAQAPTVIPKPKTLGDVLSFSKLETLVYLDPEKWVASLRAMFVSYGKEIAEEDGAEARDTHDAYMRLLGNLQSTWEQMRAALCERLPEAGRTDDPKSESEMP